MKNQSAVSLGKLGGKARASKLTKEQRQAIARLGGLQKGINYKKLSTTKDIEVVNV